MEALLDGSIKKPRSSSTLRHNRVGISPYLLHRKTEMGPISETPCVCIRSRTMDEVKINNHKRDRLTILHDRDRLRH
jgi:hypothetical protein